MKFTGSRAVGIILITLVILYLPDLKHEFQSYGYQYHSPPQQTGLVSTQCWFTPGFDWPSSECYFMKVPENHSDPEARIISFPVIVFRTSKVFSFKNPVLHLGAGGPGAPLHLERRDVVKSLIDDLDELSLNAGRDLIIMDPRGTGLSRPTLTCYTYIANELERLDENLTFTESLELSDLDFIQCAKAYQETRVDLNSYNSDSISQDVEALRKAINIDKWNLVGVSYATVYAQLLARKYPLTIESMILDSPVFLSIKAHENYIEDVMQPYQQLFNRCISANDCSVNELSSYYEKKFWETYRQLSKHPIRLNVKNYHDGRLIDFLLNGERFVDTVLYSVYAKKIFSDIEQILKDLGQNEAGSILPYVEDYVYYLLDSTYGDISSWAHYCYEESPFVDKQKLRGLSDSLPEGYIRNTSKILIDWPDQCDKLELTPASNSIAEAETIDVPTLFLQGRLDSVTPPRDVESQIGYFTAGELLLFDLSHAILGTSDCAERTAARFIDDKKIEASDEVC